MTLELFFTLQNSQSSTVKLPNQPGGAADSSQIQGLNFIDLILARLTQNTGETEEEAEGKAGEEHQLLQSDNPVLDKEPTLNLAKLLATNQDIEDQVTQDIETFGLTPTDQLSQVLALNGQALENELKPIPGTESILKGLLIETEGNENAAVLSKLEKILAKLETLAQEESPAFIATNLTPEQITQLQEQLSDNADEDPNFAIFIGLINIQQPQTGATTPEIVALSRGVVVAPRNIGQPERTAAGDTAPSNDLATKLNSLIPGGEGELTIGGKGELTIGDELDLKALQDAQTFKSLIKQAGGGKTDVASLANIGGDNNAPSSSPNLSYLQGWPFTLTGSLFAPSGWSDPILEELGIQTPGATVSNPTNLTSLLTNTQSASQAHSATQMVAATLQKNALNGENKSITLQLDPPDLGKVKVRLEFGESKTLKATMLIEKPETFLMLQRDAHVLERAIQEIGLDSSGMEFELAGHDSDFGQDGGHDGNAGGSAGGDGTESNEDLIETTMDWYVDPDTGLTRYDMLV
ncbi:MAG: hypothetical protein DHS20C02_01360 [Micavibrio sp.]|nr:MAG: hypothetical protein DHS20C02_01360 [Micavibrio sp.]